MKVRDVKMVSLRVISWAEPCPVLALCPHVKGNDLSGGMNASAQHITREEPSLLYEAKRASSAASVENNNENSCICSQMCKDASFLCPVHENTSMVLICFGLQRNYLMKRTGTGLSELMVGIQFDLELQFCLIQHLPALKKRAHCASFSSSCEGEQDSCCDEFLKSGTHNGGSDIKESITASFFGL